AGSGGQPGTVASRARLACRATEPPIAPRPMMPRVEGRTGGKVTKKGGSRRSRPSKRRSVSPQRRPTASGTRGLCGDSQDDRRPEGAEQRRPLNEVDFSCRGTASQSSRSQTDVVVRNELEPARCPITAGAQYVILR